MKRLVVIHSAQKIEIEKEKREFNEILNGFEIEHLILVKKMRVPDDIGVIIFNDGIDCMQITQIINNMKNNNTPMIRIYPLMYGYGEVKNVFVRHSKNSACEYAKTFLN